MNKLLIIIFFSMLAHFTFAQQRIVIGLNPLRGRSVDFVFRSLTEIAEGKSLGTAGVGYTEIYIYLDTIGMMGDIYQPPVRGWNLYAYANTTTLEGDFGTGDINLSEIKLHSAITSGTGVVIAESPLSANPYNLIASGLFGQGNPSGKLDSAGLGLEWTVTISYDCGKDSGTGLLGYDTDFYYTDLIIYISPTY